MKICFVLPKFTRQPIGGYKIVFEYANRLANRGNEVNILFLNEDALLQFKLPKVIRNMAANYLTKVEPKWFPLEDSIEKISSLEKDWFKKLDNMDVVFATGIQTVECVNKFFSNARKFYLIQGYENWGVSEEYLWSTYNIGFKNIVVSKWLKKVVEQHANEEPLLLQNPIDVSLYKANVGQEKRDEYTIGLLYHTEPIKGCKYALEAIYKLKEKYPDLTVQMFGMFPKPENLPEWITYKRGASQMETVQIYNSVQVFLCASVEEGYGLTGLEAMACGACLVSTSYKGVLEYAINNENALLSPVKDVDALVDNVSKVFDNKAERIRISNIGVESVKKYSWDKALESLLRYIE